MNPRSDPVRQAILVWLSQNQKRQPNPEEFLASSGAVVEATRVTVDETLAAVRNLAAHALLTGVRVDELDYPLRLRLTDLGQIVVDEYDCDVTRWLRTQRASYSDQSVHVTHAGHVAVQSSGVTQGGDVTDVVLDIPALISAAQTIKTSLPQLALTAEEAGQAQELIGEILTGAHADQVDRGRLQAAGRQLVPILSHAGTAVAGAALADGLTQALHLAGI